MRLILLTHFAKHENREIVVIITIIMVTAKTVVLIVVIQVRIIIVNTIIVTGYREVRRQQASPKWER